MTVEEKKIEKEIPQRISELKSLQYNIWSLYSQTARTMWRKLDYALWKDTNHNPVQILQRISNSNLTKMSKDPEFLNLYDKTKKLYHFELQEHSKHWFALEYPNLHKKTLIAYFSAEYGFHQSLPVYSGGLGILSGDHAKEASDIGLPFICVGFMYAQGYFKQHINPVDGKQEARYEQIDYNKVPVLPVFDKSERRLKIEVEMNGRNITVQVWKVNIGKTIVYLMDTDIDDNEPWDRELSSKLYSGDKEMRIRQEIILGIGGLKVLRELDIKPTIYHLNEGHSSFVILELLKEYIETGLSFELAKNEVSKRVLFTIHTPVSAGHDKFSFDLIESYFSKFWPQLKLSREEFLKLGLWEKKFNMTVLALTFARQSNAVSKLNEDITKEMWKKLWPNTKFKDIPIIGITNGVHLRSWLPGEFRILYEQYLDPKWLTTHDDSKLWSFISTIPDEKIWDAHSILKTKLFGFIRERARYQIIRNEIDSSQAITSGILLDPNALTIGFARRFASYKRANLVFKNLERLKKVILNKRKPVQFIFAGKAHPADSEGKSLVQEIYKFAQDPQLGGRIAFIENYDIQVARHLIAGVDIWLNTPRRPFEASGTSGMKAAMCGIPNCSISDGWWVEGFTGNNGWEIGDSTLKFDSEKEQDDFDANSLYEILENEITPLFYDIDSDGLPRKWIKMMKESIKTVSPYFSTRRMLKDYIKLMYMPTIEKIFEKN